MSGKRNMEEMTSLKKIVVRGVYNSKTVFDKINENPQKIMEKMAAIWT
jgi:hypothetical protein